MEQIQLNIDNINNLSNINDLNQLLKSCVLVYELDAVVYIFDYMKQNKYKPNDYTYQLINKLHSKKVNKNSNLKIPNNGKRKLDAKRRIHKIMKGYNYSIALKNKNLVINFLENNNYNYDGKNKKQEKVLIDLIKKNCNLPLSDIRHILTYLKRQKFFNK